MQPWVVVAGDPDELAVLRQGGADGGLQALGAVGVVEGIAQEDHALGGVAGDVFPGAAFPWDGVRGDREAASPERSLPRTSSGL